MVRLKRASVERLHGRYEQGLRACRRKEFVTTHAAFGYLDANLNALADGLDCPR